MQFNYILNYILQNITTHKSLYVNVLNITAKLICENVNMLNITELYT